ncbi:MAG TPA: hypothetical protein VFI31_08555 [Pirellulales bacterium]|nr:hypothetical protein [Pirellulales bacterium]
MAKKKAVSQKKSESPSPRPQTKKKAAKAAATATPVITNSPSIHVYRHEIDENPINAPLVVEIPIAQGRGEEPSRPSFVGFMAEMSDEYWQDQFAFRIVSLTADSVRVMVSRVDKGSPDMGWGVKLIVQVLVVGQ